MEEPEIPKRENPQMIEHPDFDMEEASNRFLSASKKSYVGRSAALMQDTKQQRVETQEVITSSNII